MDVDRFVCELASRERRAIGLCTIFATLANKAVLVGRNLDWIQRGGSIWFIPPQRLYGQMSLGLSLIEQMGTDRPYEGLNTAGLFVAMAAVADSPLPPAAPGARMNSLGLIRYVLERAGSVSEALETIRAFRLDYMAEKQYPKLHYLIADPSGEVLIYEESVQERLFTLRDNDSVAITNLTYDSPYQCPRLDQVRTSLSEGQVVDLQSAGNLLMAVSQDGTIWSGAYDLGARVFSVWLERDYETAHTFSLEEHLSRGLHSVDFGTLRLPKWMAMQ